MRPLQLANKWILITGASSGLGYEMACQLAFEFHANLILFARRRERLETLKTKLEKEANIQVKVIAGDLSKMEDVDHLLEAVLEERELYGAILNAGITYFGRNSQMMWNQFEALLQTNVISTVRITTRLTNFFEQNNKEGGLLLVSSMAGVSPIPFQAAYSASKAFIISYASAISYELKKSKFSISVYAPGGIATEMTENEKFSGLKKWLMPVKVAAKEGISAFIKRKHLYVPGFTNKVGYLVMKFMPRKFLSSQLGNVYQKALTDSENQL